MASWDNLGPTLDRSGEPWVGSFPGLGRVLVHEDGSVEAQVEPDGAAAPEVAERERALRFGWGEPLSLVRRGFACANASGVVAPDSCQGCLLLVGDPNDTSVVLPELTRRGWSVLGDRFVPTTWDELGLLAHPRDGPVLVPRARSDTKGNSGEGVRSQTDAVEVVVPRASSPAHVSAAIHLRRRRPDEHIILQVRGGERLATAALLLFSGVFAPVRERGTEPADDGARTMAEHLRLARVPFAHFGFDPESIETDIVELLRWWLTVAAPAQEEGA